MSTDPLPPAHPMPGPAPRRSRRPLMWVAAGAATIALATGGSAALAASVERPTTAATSTDDGATPTQERGGPGRHGPRGPHGEVTAIDEATLTVETGDGESVTVATTEDTAVSEAVEGSVADLAVGDSVGVHGEGADGAISARRIVSHGEGELPERPDGAPEPREGESRRGAAGEITAIDGATLTVTTADGEAVTVTTDDDTQVTLVTTLAVADIEVGDTVAVRAPEAEDGTAVTAEEIRVGELPVRGGRGPGGPGGCEPGDGEAPASEPPA